VKDKLINGALVISAFLMVLAAALLITVAIEPACLDNLDNAYYGGMPDARLAKDNTMRITADPGLLHKERWYLRQIAAERARQQGFKP